MIFVDCVGYSEGSVMTLTVTRFPVDFTGENQDNRVVGEEHTLSNKLVRVISPTYGPFYGHGLVVRSLEQNKTLIRDTDFRLTSILTNLSVKAEKDVYQAIVILDPDLEGTISIDYQAVGWLYEGDNTELANFLEDNLKPNRRVAWDLIESTLPELSQEYKDVIKNGAARYGALIVELDKIAQYITLSNVRPFELLKDDLLGQIQDGLDRLLEHMNDTSNVHELTLEQADIYENEVIDFRFSEIPMAPTELLQRPWTTGDKILYRNMNPKSFIFLSTSYLGTQTTSNTLSRLTVKEIDFKSPLFSDITLQCTTANPTSEVPGGSTTFHPSINGDPDSPILETRTYEKAVLTLTTDMPVGDYSITAVARDHLGNESLESEIEFEVKEPIPANMSGFNHNIPRDVDHATTTQSLRFWGARTQSGGPVQYYIDEISTPSLTISNLGPLNDNQTFSMTAASILQFLIDAKIKVRITNNVDTLSFVWIDVAIIRQRSFRYRGYNNSTLIVPGDGVWRISAVAGGGNGGVGGGGGGGSVRIQEFLNAYDTLTIVAGGRQQNSTVTCSGSKNFTITAFAGGDGNGAGQGGNWSQSGTTSATGSRGTNGDPSGYWATSYNWSSYSRTPNKAFWVNNRNNSDYQFSTEYIGDTKAYKMYTGNEANVNYALTAQFAWRDAINANYGAVLYDSSAAAQAALSSTIIKTINDLWAVGWVSGGRGYNTDTLPYFSMYNMYDSSNGYHGGTITDTVLTPNVYTHMSHYSWSHRVVSVMDTNGELKWKTELTGLYFREPTYLITHRKKLYYDYYVPAYGGRMTAPSAWGLDSNLGAGGNEYANGREGEVHIYYVSRV